MTEQPQQTQTQIDWSSFFNELVAILKTTNERVTRLEHDKKAKQNNMIAFESFVIESNTETVSDLIPKMTSLILASCDAIQCGRDHKIDIMNLISKGEKFKKSSVDYIM